MTTATTTDRYLKFIERVAVDPDMESKLSAIEPGNTDQVIALAAENGFTFTTEEIRQASHEARVLVHQGDELSEADLELVAGGLWGLGKVLHYVRKAVDWIDDKVNGKK